MPATTRLEAENETLRALTLKLGRVVLAGGGFEALAPDQVVTALRELSLECERLVRISHRKTCAADFEEIGIAFAEMAARIEAEFRIPAVAG
jgi:hypothetical protein